MTGPRNLSTKERFHLHVDVRGPDECWNWTGYTFPTGYGNCNRRTYGDGRANRVAYRLAHGEIPAGMDVKHSCDNRLCCNPSHLSIGTRAENMQECVARERQPRGERKRSAKLTDELVREARRRVDAGESCAAVGRDLGIGGTSIWKAVSGQTWRHVA